MFEGRCERIHASQGGAVLSALVLVLALLAACDREETVGGGTPPAEREEWFWRDRLSLRPEPLPAAPSNPSLAREVDFAIVKLIKLMIAIARINIPISCNININCRLLL